MRRHMVLGSCAWGTGSALQLHAAELRLIWNICDGSTIVHPLDMAGLTMHTRMLFDHAPNAPHADSLLPGERLHAREGDLRAGRSAPAAAVAWL